MSSKSTGVGVKSRPGVKNTTDVSSSHSSGTFTLLQIFLRHLKYFCNSRVFVYIEINKQTALKF